MNLIPINTVDAVIDEVFGGTTEMAHWCDRTPGAISQWRNNGLPSDWHYLLDREARRRGYLINPKLLDDLPSSQEKKVLRAS